jgi:2-isopropylmalate synthase
MPELKLEIFDTTLRDGAQAEGISFSVSDKLSVVKTLDEFGVRYVEAGNPFSNPKDIEFFEKAAALSLKNARLCAFGSTRRKNSAAGEDPGVLSLLQAGTPAVSVFGKAWDLHVTEVLRISREENLAMIADTLSFLKAAGKEVIFDAEHFFDGWKSDPAYAMDVLKTAVSAGADVLCLCETNGGCLPYEVESAVTEAVKAFPNRRIGIHCHNDTGCAVANSVTAVRCGAVHVQGTFTGIGERCGNADLSVLIPNFQLKMGLPCVAGDITTLQSAVIRVSETANLTVPNGKPYTGGGAFAHKGGMHIDGVNKCTRCYEHVEPSSVGNLRRFLLSEVAGRGALANKLAEIAPELKRDSPETAGILKKIKEYEHSGLQFESADASFKLRVLELLGRFKPRFKLIMYRTGGEFPPPDGDNSASAMLKIDVDGNTETAAATGNGPVHALDIALRKALSVFFPELKRVRLTDYKVRVLSAEDGAAAKVRVLIESTDGERVWSTVGASADIIQASWVALADSLEYALLKP